MVEWAKRRKGCDQSVGRRWNCEENEEVEITEEMTKPDAKDIENEEKGGVKEEEVDGRRDGQSGRIQWIEG
jgi:hypothetical protein